MRLEKYLVNEGISSVIKNTFNMFAKLEPKDLQYQLQVGWYDFVDLARKQGREEEVLKFINRTFNQNLKTLDQVNLNKLKYTLSTVKEANFQTASIISSALLFAQQKMGELWNLMKQQMNVVSFAIACLVLYIIYGAK